MAAGDTNILWQIQRQVAALQKSVTAMEGTIMTAIADLQAAVTALTTAVANISTQLSTETQTILNAVGTNPTDPAVEAAAQNIQTLVGNLNKAVSDAQTALTPPAPGP